VLYHSKQENVNFEPRPHRFTFQPAMDSKAESAPPRREPLNDEDLLAQLGYKQEFKRDFSRLELFGLSFTIVGVVQSIAAVLLFSIPYGGLVGMVRYIPILGRAC
jgi:uncharacterized membrane protein YesL